MLSINKIKFIKSLKLKKNRNKYKLFTAEGNKIVSDLLNSEFVLDTLICTDKTKDLFNINSKKIITNTNQIKKISNLKTPSETFAIFQIPENKFNLATITDTTLFLNDIQNPGNLGTIIRTATWFGIKNIICSENTVDAFNDKVVQATMGALAKINIFYVNQDSFLQNATEQNIPIYGTLLEGENIYKSKLKQKSIIIIGNEGKGIKTEIKKFITHKIHIPSYPPNSKNTESLNASIATAIVCSEFRRNILVS